MLNCSVVSNSLQHYRLQPIRLLCPWEFSRQECWSGLPCPPPGDLPNPGIEPMSHVSCIGRHVLYRWCHLRSPEYALLLLQLSHVSRVRLCDPIDGSPPGSPVPGILPGKNTGVGCHSLLQCMKVKSESEVAQLYPTLSDPMDCNLPGSSAHGIFQARVLEWVPLLSPEYALGNQKTSCGSLYFSGLEPKSAISEVCLFLKQPSSFSSPSDCLSQAAIHHPVMLLVSS